MVGKESIKLLAEVHNADLLDCNAKSSFSEDNKIKINPINGIQIKIGKIGRLSIRKYMCKD